MHYSLIQWHCLAVPIGVDLVLNVAPAPVKDWRVLQSVAHGTYHVRGLPSPSYR